MPSIIIFALLAVALIFGVAMFFFAKMPKLIPKEKIVTKIIEVDDALFSYQQDASNLVNGALSTYNDHDKFAIQTLHNTVTRRHQELEHKLVVAEADLEPYKKFKRHNEFYNLASAVIGIMRHAINNTNDLQNESLALEPIFSQLNDIDKLTQSSALTGYSVNDEVSADKAVSEINLILQQINQVDQNLGNLNLQTAEHQNIVTSIRAALRQADQDYRNLQNILSSRQYDTYANQANLLPYFIVRFNANDYVSMVTNSFAVDPSNYNYISDLREHSYRD